MLFLRSLLFSLGMIVSVIIYAPLALMTFPFPHRFRYWFISGYPAMNIWWLKVTCGLHYRLEGTENIPDSPSVIFSKHQSTWETFALTMWFRPQVWVLKRELLFVPCFGWGLALLRPIAINRSAGRSAVDQVIEQGLERLATGSWVVVFPEGTRTPAGTRRRYKTGGAHLAVAHGKPLVPIAHNAGDYWPRRQFIKKPGLIRVVVGPPIATAGRTTAEVTADAEEWIEQKVAELRGTPVPPPPGARAAADMAPNHTA
ncbi:MAG: lysophospholipid acyltransferase family protein [Pseudomonadota bacterium]